MPQSGTVCTANMTPTTTEEMPVDSIPPVFIMLAGAAIVPLLPGVLRPWAFLVAPILVLVQAILWLDSGTTVQVEAAGFTLTLLEFDDLTQVWAVIFAIVAVAGGVFALHLRDRVQQSAALAYGGSAFGVLFAGDLLTLIVFWELMAVASFLLVISGGRPNSRAAAMRYLFVHVAGGSAFLGGILWHAGETGSFALTAFDGGPAAWLALAGVLVNAASFPVHAWLSDAYPESSPTGMVFLGAFTTKTAVYVLMRLFPGWEVLLVAGAVTALYAAVYSLMQNDIRRIIAYHIISQVGFMVAVLGVGTHAALDSAADQAFTHVLWQVVMVMAVGAVLHAAGTSKLTELGGLWRPLKGVLLLYLVGACSIAFVPLLHGLSAVVYHPPVGDAATLQLAQTVIERRGVTLFLAVASSATVLAVLLRLPYYAFFGPSRGGTLAPVPIGMYVAMAAGAALSVWTSLSPETLFKALGFAVHAEEFHTDNVVIGTQVVLLSLAGGWLVLSWLRPREGVVLDTDWFYRKAGPLVRMSLQTPLEAVFTFSERTVGAVARRVTALAVAPASGWSRLLRLSAYARERGPDEALAFIGRPPMGIALAAVLLTFAVVVLAAQALNG